MSWIKAEGRADNLPRDESIFLSIWKGRVCLTAYDKEDGRFYVTMDPAINDGYCVSQEREYKFTHWMPLPNQPD